MRFWLLLLYSISCFSQLDLKQIGNSSLIKNPFDLRDPFKMPKIKPRKQGPSASSLIDKGILDNSASTFQLRLDSIFLKGIVRNQAVKRAIFGGRKGVDSTYILTEGSKISNGKVTLKAILSRGVIFVEKIINVYGQAEYLETVVPISE